MSSDAKGFDAGWLALREPLDHAARDAGLTARLATWVAARRERTGHGPGVLDLGCGAGSNLRYLLPRLGHGQRWTLIDGDAALLRVLPERIEAWCYANALQVDASRDGELRIDGAEASARVTWRRLDLVADLDSLGIAGADVVTAAALLDLCSSEWIDRLVRRCADARAAALFVLDHDGTASWDPSCADDAFVEERVARHQGRDKGFGSALGGRAGEFAARCLGDRGHEVGHARSTWRVGADAQALHAAFVDGRAQAAREIEPEAAVRIERWARERVAAVATARLEVGHHDVLGLPEP